MKRRTAVVGLATLLAGCGSVSNPPTDPPTSTATPSPTALSAETATVEPTDGEPTPANCYIEVSLRQREVAPEMAEYIEPIVYASVGSTVQDAIDEMTGSAEPACFPPESEVAGKLLEWGTENQTAQTDTYWDETGEAYAPDYLDHAYVKRSETYYVMSLTQGDQRILH